VSSVDTVTLLHTQPKLKHLAMHWANQTATDGVRQEHGMPPMECTQLSLEQSECLLGPRAGIQVSWAGTPNTKIIISCTVCRGFTLWSRLLQNTQTSMASASEAPYEAEEHAVNITEEHAVYLEEQPKKKKRINEPLDWIEVERWNRSDLLDLTEPAAASPRFWADSAGRHAGDGHRTAGGSVDRSGSGSTWRGAPHQQQEHRLLAWLGNSGGTRGVKES
jgi:hypothetical protein